MAFGLPRTRTGDMDPQDIFVTGWVCDPAFWVQFVLLTYVIEDMLSSGCCYYLLGSEFPYSLFFILFLIIVYVKFI